MVQSASRPSRVRRTLTCSLFVVGVIGCRGGGDSTSPDSQPDTAPESGPKPDQGLPADTSDAVRETVDLISSCGELENLVPVITAWTQLCQHATASGAEIAAQRIEACRSEFLARRRAEHPAGAGEPVVEGRGAEDYEAGLREALALQKYDFLAPLSLDSCDPSSD
jgi:hypothetical protein